MTTVRALGFVFASLLLGLASAGPAKAALEWEFTASGPDMEVSGVIEFAVDACLPPCLGDVVDFSVQGQTFGHAYSCEGIGCLDEAAWEILPDWELGFIAFQTDPLESVTPDVLVRLFFEIPTGSVLAVCGSAEPICNGMFDAVAEAEEVAASPVHVPEPATLTLFAGGLAGLLGWAWRRRRSS